MKLTEKKRKDILEAAIQEFREQGFTAARVNHIAELAGVSKRTLYKHFESKEVLFAAITDILMQETAALPKVEYQPDAPVKDQLISALRQYIAQLTGDDYMGLNRLVLSEFLRDQTLARAFFAKSAAHDAPISGLIGEAMSAGALRRANPTFAANQLLAMVKNFLFWPKFLLGEPPAPEADQIMSDCVDMFLAHYAK